MTVMINSDMGESYGIHSFGNDSALLQAIVAMGESLGLVLIPEGIEEPEQADALRALGCRLGQGFLFGRPVPADELTGALIAAPR